MPVCEPVTRSSISASGSAPLATPHALLVEVEQAALAVVLRLERRVGRPVVQAPELVALVERRRVERLAPAQRLDDLLDAAVAGAGRLALGRRHRGPEAEVHVGRLRV